jgi:phosphonate transport system substrate-binding protein
MIKLLSERHPCGLFRSALLVLMAMVPNAFAQNAAGQVVSYEFAPVAQHSLQLTAAYWNPILEHVSNQSGVRLRLRLARTSAETTAAVLAGEADFAFTNHLFNPERASLGWKVFARRQAPRVSGQLIVPAESPVRTLAELAGKEVAFPGPEALVAYKVTYAQLLEKNVPVTPVFAGNLDGAFSLMLSGRAAAMGSNSQMVAEYASRENRKFRVLWSSPPFNDLALMASPRVPAAAIQAVEKAFTSMHKDPAGRPILEAAAKLVQARDPLVFVDATDADYAAYRDFYRTVPASLR